MTTVTAQEMLDDRVGVLDSARRAKEMDSREYLEESLKAEIKTRQELGMTNKEIGVLVGQKDGGYVGNFLNGNQQIPVATLKKWAVALGCYEGWRKVNTANSNAVTGLCMDAQMNSRLLMVAAGTGSGKTSALEVYTKRNKDVSYVLCNYTMTDKDLLGAILRGFGLAVSGTLGSQLQRFRTHIDYHPKALVILDDFGKLTPKPQLLVQVLRDVTREQVGVVLSGTDQMKSKLLRRVRLEQTGYAELLSRIEFCLGLDKPTADVVAEICKENGLADLEAIKHIQNRAGDFRVVRSLVTTARRAMAKRQAATITQRMLEEAEVTTEWNS